LAGGVEMEEVNVRGARINSGWHCRSKIDVQTITANHKPADVSDPSDAHQQERRDRA
jgi:hypothetical protein